MSQFSASWRVALRAGRRDVLRSKGRSALIALMVGTPVMLTVTLSSLVASNNVSPQENISAAMGAAQAVARYDGGKLSQTPDGVDSAISAERIVELSLAEQATKLEAASGARVLPVEVGDGATVVIDRRGYETEVLAVDAGQPAAKGMAVVEQGRVPRAKDEVLVTASLAGHGALIGSTVSVSGDAALTVVGIGSVGSVGRSPGRQAVLVLPGTLAVASGKSFLLDRAEAVTWAEVKKLNAAGFSVVSRDVLNNPPPASEHYPDDVFLSSDNSADRAVLLIVVTAVVLEVVLLAGPAFAVGVRRQRRDLALIAASGASPRQIRRVVLGQAFVLGLLSCVIGAVLGVGLSAAAVRFGPSILPAASFGPFEVNRIPVIAAVSLGSLAAMLAALAPARQASKQEVAAVLAGRRGTIRTSRGWPLVGLLLVVAGLAVCFTLGTRQGGEIAVAGSTIAIVLGTVFLTPLVIGFVARAGGPLPLPLRLALRDTARQRARSAPAIAAVMASVAGITTLAIASASDFEQNRREYVYQTQPGRLIVSAEVDRFDEAITAATAVAGGMQFVPLALAGGDQSGVDSISVSVLSTDNYAGSSEAVVADAATLTDWGVQLDQRATSALASGAVLVAGDALIKNGQVQISIYDEKERTLELPAVVTDLGTGVVPQGPEPLLAAAVMSPETARANDIPSAIAKAISAPNLPSVSSAVQENVDAAVSGVSPRGGGAYVERGFQDSYALPFLALVGFGLLAVLVGTMTATGLALSDARPDFSTLAAVGAAPRTRRFVAGAQAIVLATLGTLLGIAVGFAPGLAATWPLTSASYAQGVEQVGNPVIEIPWLLLAVIAVAVPAFAALAAMVFTRSKLPVVRRLAQ